MTRDFQSGFGADLTNDRIDLAFFVELELSTSGSFIRAWTGHHDIDWDGHTWIGGGDLLALSEYKESFDFFASGISVTISGIKSAFISAAFNTFKRGNIGKVWMALLNEGSIINSPYQIYSGYIDSPTIRDDGTTSVITLNLESKLLEHSKASERYYTSEDQNNEVSTEDRGFEFTKKLNEWSGMWGSTYNIKANANAAATKREKRRRRTIEDLQERIARPTEEQQNVRP